MIYQARLFLILNAFCLFALLACNSQQAVTQSAATTNEPSPTTIPPTTLPPPTDTPLPAATPTIPSPTPTLVEATATATAIQITPHPGWVWYEKSEAPGVFFQLPQTWDAGTFRQRRAQAPETNSIIEVRAFEFSGSDWLAWVQRESQPGYPLVDGFVKQNGLVKGRPAFLFLEVGGGSYTMELYIRDESQIVNFFFQSAVLPRSEEEMQILLKMFETIQFAHNNEGETSLPTGWVQGYVLTRYAPDLEQLDLTSELQTLAGTIETSSDPPSFNTTLIDADDISHQVYLGTQYSFQGLPVDYLRLFPDTLSLQDQPGQPITLTLTGYQTGQSPNERFYPLWGQTTGTNGEMGFLYRPFFDLHQFDPAILGEYPASVSLYLRGPWEQVQPYLVDEPNSPLPAEILALDPAQDVIVKGTLQSTAPPRLTVEEFYYLDGGCELVRSNEQQCTFYQPVELAQ